MACAWAVQGWGGGSSPEINNFLWISPSFFFKLSPFYFLTYLLSTSLIITPLRCDPGVHFFLPKTTLAFTSQYDINYNSFRDEREIKLKCNKTLWKAPRFSVKDQNHPETISKVNILKMLREFWKRIYVVSQNVPRNSEIYQEFLQYSEKNSDLKELRKATHWKYEHRLSFQESWRIFEIIKYQLGMND